MKSFQKNKAFGLFMAVFVFSTIISTTAADSSSYPKTIVDDAGREITINTPVEQIIVLDSSSAKAVYYLGDGDKIIAVGDSVKDISGYLSDVMSKQSLGKWHEFDYELIGELAKEGTDSPPNTIVLCSVNGMAPVREIVPALEGFSDINVIGLDFYKAGNATQDLKKLGVMLDREDEAKDMINWYNDTITQIENAVAGKPKRTFFMEGSTSKGLNELTTFGLNSTDNKLMELINGYNVCRDTKYYPKVSWEWVLTKDPEFIFRSTSADSLGWARGPSQDTEKLETTKNEIMNRPGADKLDAATKDHVYIVWNSMLYGFDNVMGCAYLAKTLYPDIDLDPDEICSEYMSRLGIKNSNKRIFIYPES